MAQLTVMELQWKLLMLGKACEQAGSGVWTNGRLHIRINPSWIWGLICFYNLSYSFFCMPTLFHCNRIHLLLVCFEEGKTE